MDMKMKKGYCGRTLSQKKNKNTKINRFLITINVFGSAGPIRFVVNEDENASSVIETALRVYAREGRLPVLGSNIDNFFLYPSNAGFGALKPSDEISSYGVRNFVLCKNQSNPQMSEARSQLIDRKGRKLRLWFQKSFSLNILSH